MAYKTSGGVLDPRSMSDDELKSWAASNSSAWHTDPVNRSRYEAENKAIMSLLDERKGTQSTLDTTTGKWTTTGGSGTSGGGAATKPATTGMSSSEILALGKGPLSSAAAGQYIMTGSTNPSSSSFVIKNTPAQQSQTTPVVQQGYTQADLDAAVDAAVAAAVKQQKAQSEYDLSEYIKKQEAAALESQLAGLKGAYEQSTAELKSAQEKLPDAYNDARNSAAAQDALARRTFLEGAAYQGLGSGAAGQAELTRGATLTGTLSQIDRAQADSQAELNLQEATLASQYQQAIQQARANGDGELATALYQELVRLQGLEREDKQLAQIQEELDYNQKKLEADTKYNREQEAKMEAQERINAYLSAFGKISDLDQSLIAQSGYTTGELTALEQFYADQLEASTGAGKPTLTEAAVRAIASGGDPAQTQSPNFRAAYEYYYGIPYSSFGGVSDNVSTLRSSDPWVYSGNKDKYDNGGLTTEQVKAVQTFLNERDGLGLSVNGLWDEGSRLVSGLTANGAWERVQKELVDDLAALRSGGATAAEINSVLVNARNMGLIDAAQERELRSAYVGSGR